MVLEGFRQPVYCICTGDEGFITERDRIFGLLSSEWRPDFGISRQRFEMLKKYKNESMREQSLAAVLALSAALLDFGITEAEQEYYRNKYGKPYITGHPEIEFSLSHSGIYAVAVAVKKADVRENKGIGIDTESVKRTDMKLAKRFFRSCECRMIEESSNPQEAFMQVWTAYEACGKACGTGLDFKAEADLFEKMSEKGSIFPRCIHRIIPPAEDFCVTVCDLTEDAGL